MRKREKLNKQKNIVRVSEIAHNNLIYKVENALVLYRYC